MKGIERVHAESFTPGRGIKNRRARFKVRGERFNRNLISKFFPQRVVGLWKEPPEEVGEAGTIVTSKIYLNRYRDRKDREGYGPNAGK